MEDQALLERALQGNRSAFGQLTSRHQARSLALATGILGNREDALETLQEAYLKSWKALDQFVPGKPFFPWFYRILRNACIQRIRRRKIRQTLPLQATNPEGITLPEPVDHSAPLPEELLAKDEASQKVAHALSRLPLADREILTLKHFDGLTYREIADSLGIPVGTVMSRMSTARKRLRQLLPKDSA
jgi:RNA polymerase sigma-70 factor (ECF subfamily)